MYSALVDLIQKHKVASALVSVVLFSSLVVVVQAQSVTKEKKGGEGSSPRVVLIHPSYVADFSDDKALIGAAHHVFIGKVMEVSGEEVSDGIPGTLYTLEVLENIKGDSKGRVTVLQDGGVKDGVMYSIEDGADPLKVGSTYVLATRESAEKDWQRLISHENASKLISSDPDLSLVDARALADQDAKVKKFKAAYPHEVLLDADITHQNTGNSFQSLPPEAKAAAQSRADAARLLLEGKASAQ